MRAALPRRDPRHRPPQRVGVAEQRRPALEQQRARLGQLDVVRGAPQQLDAELVLQQPDLAAQRGLRDVQPLGRAREVALLARRRRNSRVAGDQARPSTITSSPTVRRPGSTTLQ